VVLAVARITSATTFTTSCSTEYSAATVGPASVGDLFAVTAYASSTPDAATFAAGTSSAASPISLAIALVSAPLLPYIVLLLRSGIYRML
jgi:hypothetical protein